MANKNRKYRTAPTAENIASALMKVQRASAANVGLSLAAPEMNSGKLFALDNPYAYLTPQSPKRHPGSVVSTDTLRQFADTYDPLRSCILHLIAEVQTIDMEVVARDSQDDSEPTKTDIANASAFFSDIESGHGGYMRKRSHFEASALDDLLTIGAAAIHLQRSLGGDLLQVLPIDASTIRPVVDGYGMVDPSRAYEQWVMGVPVAAYAVEDIYYDGLYPNTYSPYYKSPVEWILSPIMSGIKADEWNRVWLTDGNTPSDMYAVPEQWTPDQFQQFVGWFNELYSGDSRARQKTRFVPSGTQKVGNLGRKDQDFQEFELWLMKRTCSIFGVQPASIGYGDLQYKTSQKNSTDITSMYGAGKLLVWRKELYDYLLRRLGLPHLEVRNIAPWEEDRTQKADRLQKAVGRPWLTVNEARKEDGKDPVEGGDVLYDPAAAKVQDAQGKGANVNQEEDGDDTTSPTRVALGQWMRKAAKRVKDGRSAHCEFESEDIPEKVRRSVMDGLSTAFDGADVRRVFAPHLEN